ncbi:MAG: Fur family transcriptional regulator [Candidatus Woesearchaeota archaeon]
MQTRKTKQKQLIQTLISQQKGTFDAQQLFAAVQRHDPSIGIATIYRYLKTQPLFSFICDGKTIYSTKAHSHCHFTCEVCHTTYHIDAPPIKQPTLGKVTHFQLDFYGICHKCQQKS